MHALVEIHSGCLNASMLSFGAILERLNPMFEPRYSDTAACRVF